MTLAIFVYIIILSIIWNKLYRKIFKVYLILHIVYLLLIYIWSNPGKMLRVYSFIDFSVCKEEK